MASASVPVDLFNPGQVFACLGLLESANVLLGDARGAFAWHGNSGARFHLRAAGETGPVAAVLQFLAESNVTSLSPARSENATDDRWKVKTERLPDDAPFPFRDPDSPATLPAALAPKDGVKPTRLVIDHWGDTTKRDPVKFWAGSGGYPGAARARDAIALLPPNCADAASDPFSLSAIQSSSFRLDWRRDYIPIDAGFSINKHVDIKTIGFPLVELLAALGLGYARPRRMGVLEYRYAVVGSDDPRSPYVDPMFLRAALGCADVPLPLRTFRMYLGWPGQEGKERAITRVIEETIQ